MSDYSVQNEADYARTYDEDEMIQVRRGDLRAILDVATMSMDFASGFLDNEQVESLRKMGALLGIDPLIVTPHNFVCQYGGQHNWQPMIGFQSTRLSDAEIATKAQFDRDEAVLVETLTVAKAAFRVDTNDQDLAKSLDRAKSAITEHRARRRAYDAEYHPRVFDDAGRPTLEICVLCRHTRPLEST